MRPLDTPDLSEGFPRGPQGPRMVFGIDGTFVAPSDHGVGADFINVTPQVGPALPQISYAQPAGVPNLDHFQGLANDVPADSIYG